VFPIIVAVGWFGLDRLKASQAERAADSESILSVEAVMGYSLETSEENAVTARLHFWNGAWSIFKDNPVLGTGLETYKNVYRQYLDDIRYYSIDPHNVYLKAFAEMGIIGGAVFLWFVGVILVLIVKSLLLIKKIKRDSDKALLLGLSMGLLGSLTHNFVELDWQFPTNVIIFFVVLGVFYKVYLLQCHTVETESIHEQRKVVYRKGTVAAMLLVAFLVMTGGVLLFFSETYQTAGNNAVTDFELTKAERAYSSALRFNPLSYNAHFGLAQVYYYLIPEDKEHYLFQYKEELERVISLNASDYRARQLLGVHYLLSKDYQNAIWFLKQAVGANVVGMPELYLALATAYHKQGDVDKAIAVLERAVSRYQPSLSESVIWVTNDRESILNNIASLHVGLGSIYHEQGEATKAKEQYEKALEYDADNEKALQNLSKLLIEKEIILR